MAVLSPRCGHCAAAHKAISKLKDCRIDYLIVTQPDDHAGMLAAQHFISLSSSGAWAQACEAMSRWYNNGTLTQTQPADHTATEQTLKDHNALCATIGISGTPAIFVNGRPLPEVYNVSDLEYIL